MQCRHVLGLRRLLSPFTGNAAPRQPRSCVHDAMWSIAVLTCNNASSMVLHRSSLRTKRRLMSTQVATMAELRRTCCSSVWLDSLLAASQDGTVYPVMWLKLVMTFCNLCLIYRRLCCSFIDRLVSVYLSPSLDNGLCLLCSSLEVLLIHTALYKFSFIIMAIIIINTWTRSTVLSRITWVLYGRPVANAFEQTTNSWTTNNWRHTDEERFAMPTSLIATPKERWREKCHILTFSQI